MTVPFTLNNLSPKETAALFPPGKTPCIIGYNGSIAHGTKYEKDNPNELDDIDIMGIFLGWEQDYLGFKNFDHFTLQKDEYDIVCYDLKKAFNLLMKGNPNILGHLWLREEHYIYVSYLGRKIIRNRELFLSKECYKSFMGYAYSQLQKMTQNQAYEGYMGKKRKILKDKFGYDPRNASHLIRLMHMCIEFLDTGKVNVYRDNAAELISIKKGEWSLEAVGLESNRLFKEAEEKFKTTALPERPNVEAIEKLQIEILKDHLNGRA